ncbi:MAG: glutamine-hydrolyzing GMP synthase [Bacteroidales bacterium]|nr:glutamine-hydrolyzing GMP synthase [Bacteroidales bacterium]
MQEKIIILDFGSQYTQLIARRIRELNVYCEIYPFSREKYIDETVKGVILSGSPFSVYDKGAPSPEISFLRNSIPLLGICYGAQYLVHLEGGRVKPSVSREYGRANLVDIDNSDPLIGNVSQGSQVWMSHGDSIIDVPENFEVIGSTSAVKVAAFRISGEKTWGIQFHPEVHHTAEGKQMLKNFVYDICGCSGEWTPGSFVESAVGKIKSEVGHDHVILGLSGGVDSTVAASLMNKAVGKNLTCIFVDNGLLRKNEFRNVLDSYFQMGLNVIGVDAGKRFIDSLEGISDPELKRKTIGRLFVEIFEEEAGKIKDVKWLAQGTIYPDVIESAPVNGPSAKIKSHHNVGGLPDKMKLKVIEPLRLLFKDEVRRVGAELGVPDLFLKRHPFPGPGLAVRLLGEITGKRLEILREADAIFIEGLRRRGLYDEVWQAGAVLLPVQSTGVMGDERTYENAVVLRAVTSSDGMTADWARLPYEFLAEISNEIINKVKGINRVVYDISSKPPATIEWE